MSTSLRLVLLALSAATSAVVGVGAQGVCARNATVQSLGETCDFISNLFNASTFQVAFVNQNTVDAACDNLHVGEVLCLGVVGQDCTTTHTVVSGDFCASIAGAAGIDASTLLANNPNVNSDCSNIYPGEVLCTSSELFTYTDTADV
ncbi:hypothetical protein HETIRDRAFT_426061 [Heterobasidion irregulare TC 32-1]|uniref:LysM domain-containing protein n=1 Tax=Heterobasidion irregulare (strain TC 32-1) TaxID=747525 RepID=W4KIM6_HETIT|nr:uncharacterized protein HETIRDRAFT_426061 [Heterobasidion irregulare TC 32-1]ETW84901.1 hypothetical protein HETIRDRAFT_426061 [Heterobasidion irregulare TC 32-1]